MSILVVDNLTKTWRDRDYNQNLKFNQKLVKIVEFVNYMDTFVTLICEINFFRDDN